MQNIQFFIQEISFAKTNFSLFEAEKAIEEMKNANFPFSFLESKFKEAIILLEKHNYKEADRLSREIIEIQKKAFEVNDLIKKVRRALESPRKTYSILGYVIYETDDLSELGKPPMSISGNFVFESKNIAELLDLASLAFERGDYVLAMERAEQARMLLLLERKGNLLFFISLYWHYIFMVMVLFFLIGMFGYKRYRLSSVVGRIKYLTKEERNIVRLIADNQHKYYSGKISIDLYNKNLVQHRKRIAEIKTEREELRNKKMRIINPEKLEKEINREAKKVEEDIKKLQTKFYKTRKINGEEYKLQFKFLNECLSEIEKERMVLRTNKKEKKKNAKKKN